MMMQLLLMMGSCQCWLSDHFDLSNGSSEVYTRDAVAKLKGCLKDVDVEGWEKSIRRRVINEEICRDLVQVRRCMYVGRYIEYQDATSKYIRLLVSDAEILCWDNRIKAEEIIVHRLVIDQNRTEIKMDVEMKPSVGMWLFGIYLFVITIIMVCVCVAGGLERQQVN